MNILLVYYQSLRCLPAASEVPLSPELHLNTPLSPKAASEVPLLPELHLNTPCHQKLHLKWHCYLSCI